MCTYNTKRVVHLNCFSCTCTGDLLKKKIHGRKTYALYVYPHHIDTEYKIVGAVKKIYL